MTIYIFDGSFDGMLSAVFDSFARKENVDILQTSEAPLPLFYDTLHEVATDNEKASRVWRKFRKTVSKGASSALTAAFLTDSADFPLHALRFISRAVTSTSTIENDFSDPSVLAVLKEVRRVRGEAHRLLQFVRFQKAADGTYFAMTEPMFDVLPMAVNHFVDRFSDQPFILYDRCRDYGYHYDGTETRRITLSETQGRITSSGKLTADIADKSERLYQELWRTYFKAIAITERTNPRKQRQDMPVRYWKYLTEMNE